MENRTDIILKGGTTYRGFVVENADSIKITCEDPVPAVIEGSIHLYKCKAIHLSGIVLRGAGWNKDSGKGLFIQECQQIEVKNIEVSGFAEAGIEIKDSKDILLEGCFAYRNGFSGICTSLEENHNEHITIRHCKAYDNGGTHVINDNHSGSGIAIFHAKDVLVEYCEAAGNGWAQRQKNINGPVGIWCACDVDGIVFRKCISRHNRTQPGGVDGDGFDIDGGVRNGLMEDDYSYENEGSGYLFCEYGSGVFFDHNHMHRCVSLGDATRVTHQGSVQYYGPEGIPMSDSHSADCLLVPADGHACVVNHEMGSECRDITLTHSVLVPSKAAVVTHADSKRAEVKDNVILDEPSIREKLLGSVARLTDPRDLDEAPVFRYLAERTLEQQLRTVEVPELFKTKEMSDFSGERLKFYYKLNGRDFEGSHLKAHAFDDAVICYDSIGPDYALCMKNDTRLEFEHPSWDTSEKYLAVLEARLENPETQAWLFVAADGQIVDAVAVGGTVGEYKAVVLPFGGFEGVPTIGVLTQGDGGCVYLKDIKIYRVISEKNYQKQMEPCTFGDVYFKDGRVVLNGRGSRLINRLYAFGKINISASSDAEAGLLFVRNLNGEQKEVVLNKEEKVLTFDAEGFVEFGVVNTGDEIISVEIQCQH